MALYNIKDNFLTETNRLKIKKRLEESTLWGKFGDREAFTFTFIKNNIPEDFKAFVTQKHNVYQFVALKVKEGGAIEDHIDDDFAESFKKYQPGAIVGLPETTVYYVDIDNSMKGGNLIVEGETIKPTTNKAVILSPGCTHKVSNMKAGCNPRLTIVCEKYRILSKFLPHIKTPNYKSG